MIENVFVTKRMDFYKKRLFSLLTFSSSLLPVSLLLVVVDVGRHKTE